MSMRKLGPSSALTFEPKPKAVKIEIHHGCRIQGEHLAENESAHDGNTQRPPKLRTHAPAQRQGKRPEQRGHGDHDGPKS